MKKRTLTLVISLLLVALVAVGGTLAWLKAETTAVVNTFSPSDIGVTLEETDTDPNTEGIQHDYEMVPGWTIAKDPKAAVTEGSEEAWLFVKIVESANFDSYMTYAIADGWETVVQETTNTDGTKYTVVGRIIDGTKDEKAFGTAYSVLANDNVTVLDTVTKDNMTAAVDNEPTLTFTAYATQLYKTNPTNENPEFTAAEAWAIAQTQPAN